jgi:hypothetical protein
MTASSQRSFWHHCHPATATIDTATLYSIPLSFFFFFFFLITFFLGALSFDDHSSANSDPFSTKIPPKWPPAHARHFGTTPTQPLPLLAPPLYIISTSLSLFFFSSFFFLFFLNIGASSSNDHNSVNNQPYPTKIPPKWPPAHARHFGTTPTQPLPLPTPLPPTDDRLVLDRAAHDHDRVVDRAVGLLDKLLGTAAQHNRNLRI